MLQFLINMVKSLFCEHDFHPNGYDRAGNVLYICSKCKIESVE